MRKMIFALMLLSTAAQAETILVSENKTGGEIVLTMRDNFCKKWSLLDGYAYNPGAEVYRFCWAYIDEKVQVIYNDGSQRIYEPRGFKSREVNKTAGSIKPL